MRIHPKSALWAAVALVSMSNLHAGGSKLIAREWMVNEFVTIMRLPLWMMYFIGMAQLLTGLLLLPGKTRRQAGCLRQCAVVLLGHDIRPGVGYGHLCSDSFSFHDAFLVYLLQINRKLKSKSEG